MLAIVRAVLADAEPAAHLRKPFNPVLGETARHVLAFVDGDEVRSTLEQVSHHPPITAFDSRGDGFAVAGHFRATPRLAGFRVEVDLAGVRLRRRRAVGRNYRRTKYDRTTSTRDDGDVRVGLRRVRVALFASHADVHERVETLPRGVRIHRRRRRDSTRSRRSRPRPRVPFPTPTDRTFGYRPFTDIGTFEGCYFHVRRGRRGGDGASLRRLRSPRRARPRPGRALGRIRSVVRRLRRARHRDAVRRVGRSRGTVGRRKKFGTHVGARLVRDAVGEVGRGEARETSGGDEGTRRTARSTTRGRRVAAEVVRARRTRGNVEAERLRRGD